jgi:hypothetical protein
LLEKEQNHTSWFMTQLEIITQHSDKDVKIISKYWKHLIIIFRIEVSISKLYISRHTKIPCAVQSGADISGRFYQHQISQWLCL